MFRRNPSPETPTKPVETPKAMLARVEAELAAQRLRDQYAEERAVRDAQITVERVESLSVEAETVKTDRQRRRQEFTDKVINYGPLVVISGLAIIGQYGSFSDILTPVFGEILGSIIGGFCAVALEMIALFLGLHALKALRRKDSAAGLLFAATIVAGLVAWLNFTHFESKSITVAWTFALFSFVAPFMWRIKIRSDHRDELVENGEIDKRGLRLERSRLLWHPIKSLQVMSHAGWTGERDRDKAVADWEAMRAEKLANKPVKPAKDSTPVATREELDMLQAMIENLQHDLRNAAKEEPPAVQNVAEPRAITAGTNGYNHKHPMWEKGVAIYEASIDSGSALTQADLARELGMSNRVLAGQIQKYVRARNEGKNYSVDHDGSDLTSETA
jgi:hypothetical protein